MAGVLGTPLVVSMPSCLCAVILEKEGPCWGVECYTDADHRVNIKCAYESHKILREQCCTYMCAWVLWRVCVVQQWWGFTCASNESVCSCIAYCSAFYLQDSLLVMLRANVDNIVSGSGAAKSSYGEQDSYAKASELGSE